MEVSTCGDLHRGLSTLTNVHIRFYRPRRVSQIRITLIFFHDIALKWEAAGRKICVYNNAYFLELI